MPAIAILETGAGVALVFFLPGYGLTKAVFPEWRVRGTAGLRRLVELVTLSFVLSVALTVLVGYLLLASSPGGFQASWTDPLLEISLAGIAVVGLGAALVRGGFSREPPVGASPPPVAHGEEDALELTRQLDELGREARRIQHTLRAQRATASERERLEARLSEIDRESAELRAGREAEYAG